MVRDAMLADLPHPYDAVAAIVRASFDDAAFTGWMLWPVSEAVAHRALQSGRDADFDDAMELLALVTTRLSGEFAIRAMLNARLDRTLEIAQTWTASPDMHVRRLASEGTRSHLPWAKGVPELVERSGLTRSIVDSLYTDEHEDVRRSVANHVNDLSRDAQHTLRTTIKTGHPKALELMGFSGAQFDVDGPAIVEREVPLGSDVRFGAHITNTGTQTTRTFHPGEHAIELQINGRPYGRSTFLLTSPQESP